MHNKIQNWSAISKVTNGEFFKKQINMDSIISPGTFKISLIFLIKKNKHNLTCENLIDVCKGYKNMCNPTELRIMKDGYFFKRLITVASRLSFPCFFPVIIINSMMQIVTRVIKVKMSVNSKIKRHTWKNEFSNIWDNLLNFAKVNRNVV